MRLKQWMLGIALVISLLPFQAALASSDIAIRVSGMVCAFCAAGIEKAFNANEAVEAVDVNLNNKLVKVKVKAGAQLSDEQITKMIVDSGYNVVAIER